MLDVLDALRGRRGVAAGARSAADPRPASHGVRRGRRLWADAAVLAGACLGTLGVAPARVAAQAPAGAPAGPFAGVTLSDSQRGSLRALGARTNAAVAPLMGRLQHVTPADSLAARATRDSLHAIYAAHNASTRAVLTADQRTTFDANLRALAAAHDADLRAQDRQRTLTALVNGVTTSSTPVVVTPPVVSPPPVSPPVATRGRP